MLHPPEWGFFVSSDPFRFLPPPFPLLKLREIWALEALAYEFPSLQGEPSYPFEPDRLARLSVESSSAAQRHSARFMLGVWGGTSLLNPLWFPPEVAGLIEPFDFHRAWRVWGERERRGLLEWIDRGGWIPSGRE